MCGAQSDQSPAAGRLFEFSSQKLKQHDLLATHWLLYSVALSFALLHGQSSHGNLQKALLEDDVVYEQP